MLGRDWKGRNGEWVELGKERRGGGCKGWNKGEEKKKGVVWMGGWEGI